MAVGAIAFAVGAIAVGGLRWRSPSRSVRSPSHSERVISEGFLNTFKEAWTRHEEWSNKAVAAEAKDCRE